MTIIDQTIDQHWIELKMTTDGSMCELTVPFVKINGHRLQTGALVGRASSSWRIHATKGTEVIMDIDSLQHTFPHRVQSSRIMVQVHSLGNGTFRASSMAQKKKETDTAAKQQGRWERTAF